MLVDETLIQQAEGVTALRDLVMHICDNCNLQSQSRTAVNNAYLLYCVNDDLAPDHTYILPC